MRWIVGVFGWASLCGCDPRGSLRRPRPLIQLACGVGPTVAGVDVSEHQGAVSWQEVRASGRRFAYARAGVGARADATFARNWRGMREAGLFRGAYLYVMPEQDIATQAALLTSAVGRLGPGDLPAALDVEKMPPGVPPPGVYASRLGELVARVREGTGRDPVIYTGAHYWPRWVRSDAFAALRLWHPQYAPVRCPTIASPWRAWTFWQLTDRGVVPGVRGAVDLDVFNGDDAALQRLAGGALADAGALNLDATPAPPTGPAATPPTDGPSPATP